jgi:DNA polymerase-2
LKVRGIEVRRHDTPPFIAQTQMDMLEILAQAPDVPALRAYLPQAYAHLQQRLQALRRGVVPLPDLLASLKMSRELEQYRTPSPAARAALQLQKIGKEVRPGQRVRFLYLRGEPDVHAWDLPEEPDARRIDIAMYEKLMRRAAESVLLPLGGGELLNPTLQPSLFPPRQHRQRLPVIASKMPAQVLVPVSERMPDPALSPVAQS